MKALNTPAPPLLAHPALALHGSVGSGRQFQSLRKFGNFANGFQSPDIAGYEQQALLHDAPVPCLDERPTPLRAWLNQCDSPAHIFAHSFGCTLTAELTLESPEWIASLSFYEPVITGLLTLSETRSDAERLNTWVELWKSIRHSSTGSEIRLFLDYWAGAGIWEKLSEDKKRKLRSLAKPKAADLGQALSHSRDRYCFLLKSIPSHLIVGTASPVQHTSSYTLDKERGKQDRYFCSRCRSIMHWHWDRFEDRARIAGGCLTVNPPEPLISACHDKKKSWMTIPETWRIYRS